MKSILLIFSVLFICACSSNTTAPDTANKVIGKWKLVAQLQDPGDGSGTFQPIDSARVIEFFDDGTIAVNGVLCIMSSEVGSRETGVYMLITDSNNDTQNDGEIIPNTCTSRSAKVFFDLPENNNLILWYQCIEACGQKFEKIN